jgi:dolichol kinase
VEYKREIGRKAVHFFGSIGIALLVYYVDKLVAFTLLFIGFAIMYYLNQLHMSRKKVPILSDLLDLFERGFENNPAKGAIDFFLAFSIITFLFPTNIVVVTILIVGFGDTFSTLVGKPMGGRIFRRISHKSIEGSIAFFVTALIPALFLLPFNIAISACFMAALTELTFHEYVDDNIAVSFSTSIVLFIVMYVI